MKTSTVLTLAAAAVWFSAFGLPAQETAAQWHELATNHLKRIAGEMSARCLSDIRTLNDWDAIWFALHGVACLVLDTLEFGEVAGLHHGTHNLNLWHWLSLGYTPAGVELWSAMRTLEPHSRGGRPGGPQRSAAVPP